MTLEKGINLLWKKKRKGERKKKEGREEMRNTYSFVKVKWVKRWKMFRIALSISHNRGNYKVCGSAEEQTMVAFYRFKNGTQQVVTSLYSHN